MVQGAGGCSRREGGNRRSRGHHRNQDQEEKTRGMMRLERSGGAPDRREERTETERKGARCPITAFDLSLSSSFSCNRILTEGRNHTGEVGRRGDYLRDE